MANVSIVTRTFLQACGNHGTLNKDRASEILRNIWEKYIGDEIPYTEEKLLQIVEIINKQISDFDQEIKIIKFELTEEEYLVFTNTTEASIHKFQKCVSTADVNYFYLIIKEIMLTDDYCLNPIALLNLTSELNVRSFTKNHAENLIDEWINHGYFINQNDRIYFGPKIITEFQPYIKRNFAEIISDCDLCKNITFWPTSCNNCERLFHNACIQKYLSRISKCPSCTKPWDSA